MVYQPNERDIEQLEVYIELMIIPLLTPIVAHMCSVTTCCRAAHAVQPCFIRTCRQRAQLGHLFPACLELIDRCFGSRVAALLADESMRELSGVTTEDACV